MVTIEHLRKFTMKKPELSDKEAVFEKLKNEMAQRFKECQSRYRSLIILSEPDDVLILAERLVLDLANLALLIYGEKEAKGWVEAECKLKRLLNQDILHLFIDVTELYQESYSAPTKYRKNQILYRKKRLSCKLLYQLKKAISAKKKELKTSLDSYKKRLRYQVSIVLLVVLVVCAVLWGVNHHGKMKMIEETRSDLTYLANMAFKAKKILKRPLFEITGSRCSYCPCGNLRKIKKISSTDPCAKAWDSALKKIYKVVEGASVIPERYLRDPWGSPYAPDENERENGERDCRNDTVRSVGEDGILETYDDIVVYIENVFCR